jgi:biopolymer transport protein ExbD
MIGRHKTSSDAGTEVTLPIAPMLDMAFQLLTFFIFTYHPSAMEGQLALTLPATKEAIPDKPDGVKPGMPVNPKVDLDIPLDLNVRIQSRTSGYTLVLEEGALQTPVANVEALRKQLGKIFKEREASIQDKAKSVDASKREDFIEEEKKKLGAKVLGDSKLRWGNVVEVMDTCRSAGFGNVSFAPPPDLGQ